ncbi:MAG: hypothetical protein WD355_11300, partial [Balneolaceae bacterium]
MNKYGAQTFTVIGPGRLGRSLIDGLKAAGFKPLSIFSRSEPERDLFSASAGVLCKKGLPASEEETGRWVFITTQDDQIGRVAESLSVSGVDWNNRNLIHCSGNHHSGLLENVAERGARIASMHPLQTFSHESSGSAFEGITVTLEGNPALTRELSDVVQVMGGEPLILDREQKRILHAAA